MKGIAYPLFAILAFCAGCRPANEPTPVGEHMQVTHAAARSSVKGAPSNFTGAVVVTQLFAATKESSTTGGSVTFEPGARSAWHTHPAGQTLIITAGTGWVQEWGGVKQEVRAGDVVWTPPGVKHWHGATATASMTHLAIQEQVGGKAVEWMEPVTDEQYSAKETASPADDARAFSPVLDELWKRPGLSPRDRSVVTLAVLVARNQTAEMPRYFDIALDRGVTATELSELITHLAFYAGWANVTSAIAIADQTFAKRGIRPTAASEPRLPLDEAAEAERATRVESSFGAIAPGVVHYTTDVIFRDLWLRPALAPRDRSIVTVAALIANGQVAQIPYHLNRAMDNGLSATEVSEMMTQLAFYAGWPSVFGALPTVKDVLEKRPNR